MTESEQPENREITQAARDWIMRLASGEITQEELAEHRLWAAEPTHQAVFQHELALWRSLGAIGDRLAPMVGDDRSGVQPRWAKRSWQAGVAVAASIAIMLAAPEALLRMKSDYRTGIEVESVALPDGSLAVLDAGSAMAVRYDGTERRIELLKGRAWFQVAHGQRRPFRVDARGAMVEDIGTAFEVGLSESGARVAVSQGAVRVRSPAGSTAGMKMTAGQVARWRQGAAAVAADPMPAGRIAAWRDGDILLDHVDVRTAIEEIARYRSGLTFVMGDVDALPAVTAIIRAARPDEGLDALAANAGLETLRLPAGILVVRPTI